MPTKCLFTTRRRRSQPYGGEPGGHHLSQVARGEGPAHTGPPSDSEPAEGSGSRVSQVGGEGRAGTHRRAQGGIPTRGAELPPAIVHLDSEKESVSLDGNGHRCPQRSQGGPWTGTPSEAPNAPSSQVLDAKYGFPLGGTGAPRNGWFQSWTGRAESEPGTSCLARELKEGGGHGGMTQSQLGFWSRGKNQGQFGHQTSNSNNKTGKVGAHLHSFLLSRQVNSRPFGEEPCVESLPSAGAASLVLPDLQASQACACTCVYTAQSMCTSHACPLRRAPPRAPRSRLCCEMT